MKTIFQKHTSKFVAGLFNSLGIIACVSLTACGEDKGNQTEKQIETLKSGLLSKYSNLNETDAEVIAEWLEKNKKDISGLNGDILKEIFKNDTNKLNAIAGQLGVILTESDLKPEDEKQKKINEWLTKLNGLNNDAFNELDESLKEKVAQKFIASGIDINEVTVIQEKLAGFIKDVKDEKKQNEISIKVGGDGKVTITTADKTTNEIDFDSLEKLQNFVEALKGKEITEEVELSFAFDKENVKICGHKSGFEITDYVVDLLNYFEYLTKIKGLNLTVSGLSLKISGGKLLLNTMDLSSVDYFKDAKFWILVKDHAALFGITEGSEFEIKKTGGDGSETVKIGEFVTQLKWSEVVESEKTFKADSGWGNIFKLKNEAAEEVKDVVTVEFENGKCTCKEIKDYNDGFVLNSLDALKKLVADLKDKKVTIGNSKNFSLAFDGKNVNVCGHSTGVDITKDTDFATLLGYVKSLKGEGKAIEDKFKIEIAVDSNDIKLGEGKIDQDFMKTQVFWNAVKAYKDDLFEVLPITVSRNGDDNLVKIGNTVTEVTAFQDAKTIIADWNGIFKVKG